MKIISVVGARPNFMKIAPFIRAIEEYNQEKSEKIGHLLVHTGQHYDYQMSQTFFDALSIPPIDIHLGVGSGTHSEQVGNTMIAFEKVLNEEKPSWVVVVGDVNATLACSITAKKLNVKCCHIEAGLRSGDDRMPEEINRIVTDRLSDLLLTPDRLSIENLIKEGIKDSKISFVGNIMIDTLKTEKEKAAVIPLMDVVKDNLLLENSVLPDIKGEEYFVITLHRPSNVDNCNIFEDLVNFLTSEVILDMPLIWPIHPRAQKQLELFGLWDKVISTPNMVLMRPVGYHEMLRLNMCAKLILTDSGGIQGESTFLGKICLILRNNTEWTVTLKEHGGTNVLVGNNVRSIRQAYNAALKVEVNRTIPELWDGNTASRCLKAILDADKTS